MSTTTYQNQGIVVDRATGSGVSGLRVEIWDSAGICRDLVAFAVTDTSGRFTISVDATVLRDLFKSRAAVVYFKVLSVDQVLAKTDGVQTWTIGGTSSTEITTRLMVDVARVLSRETVVTQVVVRGDVNDALIGGPSVGTTIKVFDRGIRTETQLAQTTTDARGHYNVSAPAPTSGGKTTFDIIVRAYNASGGVTAEVVRCHVAPTSTIDLVLNGTTYGGVPEYASAQSKISALLGSIDPTTLTSTEIERTACSAQIDSRSVAAFVGASQIAPQAPGVSTEVLYGLLRQGLPATAAGLFARSTNELQRLVLAAVDQNQISGSIKANIATVRTALENAAVTAAFLPRAGARGLGEVIAATPGATATQQQTFVRKALQSPTDETSFWAAVAADSTLAPIQTALRFTVDAGAVTFNHPALLTYLHTLRVANTITTAADLAKYDQSQWLGFLSAQNITPPAEVPGATLAAQRTAFSQMIARAVEGKYKTKVIGARVGGDTQLFVNNNPSFDVATKRVGAYLASTPTALNGLSNPTVFVPYLKAIERINKVTASVAETQTLVNAGIKSARQIVDMGRNGFVNQYKAQLGEGSAIRIFYAASWQASGASALLAKYHGAFQPNISKLFPNYAQPSNSLPGAVADWSTLFGATSVCACDACSSFYSPAAYLVDLLQYLKRQPSPLGTAKDSFLSRRPDVPLIELSCANATRLLPMIDLVNEILEVALSRKITLGAWPIGTVRVNASSDELAAEPEIVYPTQYATAYQYLANSVYPFICPFQLYALEARTYLNHLGVPRGDLVRAFDDGKAPFVGSADAWADFAAAEDIGLSLPERDAVLGTTAGLTASQYWGFPANDPNYVTTLAPLTTFMQRSGLSYDETRELLACRSYAAPVLSITGPATCDVTAMSVVGLSATVLSNLHRFLRLRKRLGVSLLEADAITAAFAGQVDLIDRAALQKIGGFLTLKNRFSVPTREMLAWWASIDVYPGNGAPQSGDWPSSLYADLFQDRSLQNPINAAFTLPSTPTLSAALPGLRAALRVSATDLSVLLDAPLALENAGVAPVFPPPQTPAATTLSVADLSRLFRITSFARAADLTVAELRALTALSGSNALTGDADTTLGAGPVATPKTTLAFLDMLGRLRATGMSVGEAAYVFRHITPRGSSIAPSTRTIDGWVKEVNDLVARAMASASNVVDPDGTLCMSLLGELGVAPAEAQVLIDAIRGLSAATTAQQWTILSADIGRFLLDAPATAQALLCWHPANAEDATLIPDRFAYLAERLLRAAKTIRDLRTWISTKFGISEWAARHLLQSGVLPGAGAAMPMTGPPSIVAFDFVPLASPAATDADRRANLVRLEKAARILRSLHLSDDEVVAFFPASLVATLPQLSLASLPTTSPVDAWSDLSASAGRFSAWMRLVDLARFRDSLAGGAPDLLTMLSASSVSGATESKVRDTLAKITGWDRTDIATLADRFGLIGTHGLDGDRPLIQLQSALSVVRTLGVAASSAVTWGRIDAPMPVPQGAQPASPRADEISADTKRAARARHDAASWKDAAKPLRDMLREAQRDALVAAYINLDGTVKTANDVYQALLVDVSMSAADRTSRIVQANAAIQQYIERCILGLESGVTFDTDAVAEWDWISRYRVWEANRKIFAYPENWIDAELRDDKTELFADLERRLLSSDITNQTAEDAIRAYTRGLLDIANLEVRAVLEERPQKQSLGVFQLPLVLSPEAGATPANAIAAALNGTAQPSVTPVETLHVFARSGGGTYYYRRRYGVSWTPWEKLDLDIEGDHLVPVLYHDQIFLFWTAAQQKSEPIKTDNQPHDKDEVPPTPEQYWEVKVAWSALRHGEWSRKRLSKDSIKVRPATTAQGFVSDLGGHSDFSTLAGLTLFGSVDADRIAIRIAFIVGGVDTGGVAQTLGRFYYDPCSDNLMVKLSGSSDVGWAQNGNPPADAEVDSGQNISGRFAFNTLLKLYVPGGASFFGYEFLLSNGPLAPGGAFNFMMTGDRTKLTFPTRLVTVRDSKRTFLARRLRALPPAPGAQAVYVEPTAAPDDDPTTDAYHARSWQFEVLSHPFACTFVRQVERRGVPGLLRWSLQEQPIQQLTTGIESEYAPLSQYVATPFPKEEVEFALRGSMSVYNWELFFHAPFRIATALFRAGKYKEARNWLHYIFDPTDRSNGPAPQRYWKFVPFNTNKDLASIQADLVAVSDNAYVQAIQAWMNLDKGTPSAENLQQEIATYREDPFSPFAIARLRPVAFQKAVVMLYLDNLIAWGDELFAEDTRESVQEATQLYVLAATLLGDRPILVKNPVQPAPQTYAQLEPTLDALSNALVEAEGPVPLAPSWGMIWNAKLPKAPAALKELYFCVPPNDKLTGYWDTVADRLFKIRHSMNLEGTVRELSLLAPPIDPALLVRAKALGVDISSVLSDLQAPNPKHRFAVLHARATDFTNFVVQLGSELQGVLERRDGEELGLLRQRHEMSILDAARESKRKAVSDAEASITVLLKNQATVQARANYYTQLPRRIAEEDQFVDSSLTSMQLAEGAAGAKLAGAALAVIPDFLVGFSGFSPTAESKITGGSLFAGAAELASGYWSMMSAKAGADAALSRERAGWLRRDAEWEQQLSQALLELKSIEKQLVAAQIKLEIAQNDLATHEKQMEQSREVNDFLKSKFTNQQLFDWMAAQTGTLHFQAYKLAYDLAKKAERAYQLERGEGQTSIIQFGHWEGSKRGLLAGQRLMLDLKRLEAAWFDGARREYEITKHVPLSEVAPVALLSLIGTGTCTLSIADTEFDLDYPGHYLRRLKAVGVTTAYVAPAWESIQMKLTLTGSKVSRAAGAAAVQDFGMIQSMVTSGGQNDTGLFETNLHDDRFLPFEGAGAVSDWKIELPLQTNRFDRRSVSDVVMHLRYTARDGGAPASPLLTNLAGSTRHRLVSLRRDFPDAFARFVTGNAGNHQFKIWLPKSSFQPVFGKPGINVSSVKIYTRKGSGTLPGALTVTLPQVAATTVALAGDAATGLSLATPGGGWTGSDLTDDPHALLIETTAAITDDTFDEIWLVLDYVGV